MIMILRASVVMTEVFTGSESGVSRYGTGMVYIYTGCCGIGVT